MEVNPRIISELQRYGSHRIDPTLPLVVAMVSNDLMAFFAYADEIDYATLPRLVISLYTHVPEAARGSTHAYRNWISGGCGGNHDWGSPLSVCCGASILEPGWPDSDFCSKCHDHAGSVIRTCTHCELEEEVTL